MMNYFIDTCKNHTSLLDMQTHSVWEYCLRKREGYDFPLIYLMLLHAVLGYRDENYIPIKSSDLHTEKG